VIATARCRTLRQSGTGFLGRRILAAVTWIYIAWSLVPVVLAFAASVGVGPSAESGPLGFDAYRFALSNSGVLTTFRHSVLLATATVCIALPLGAGLGLALSHVARRAWQPVRASLLILVALPHTALAVAVFYLFAFVIRAHLGSVAQSVAHVTVALPFVSLIVWTRVVLLDASYEEQAADLGASPLSTIRRVLLPLCTPALVVAAAVAFAISFNEIPLSDYLCIGNDCRTIPVMLAFSRGGDVPATAFAISAMATMLSLSTLFAGVLAVRVARRRRHADGAEARRTGRTASAMLGAEKPR
jgi:spermidine/putrescine transport system permease protein